LRSSLPVEITAQHAGTRKIMAGPLRGKILDFSKYNASLLMSQIMDEKYHLFYSTQEDNLLFLNIYLDMNPSFGKLCELTALPLWFNIFQQGQIRNFIMGVEFTRNTEEKIVKKLLAKQLKTL
jgi:hypothetical protein